MNLGRDTHIQSIANGKEWGFPRGAVVNNLSAKAGDAGDEAVQSLGQEDPLEKKMATHSSILPGKTHGQRSLAGYSPCTHTHTRREQTEIQAKRTYQTWDTEYERNKESAMTSSFWAQSAGRMESLVPEIGKTAAGGSLQVED